jgi:hypothetical protein
MPFRAWSRRAVLAVVSALAARAASGQTASPPAASGQTASPPHEAEPAVASYVSSRINAKPLPVIDRATDPGGVRYLIEFDELILTIRANHEFRASLRYRQTLAAKGDKLGLDPIQKMTVYGTWSVVNGELRFVPDPKRGGNDLRILSGTFSGNRIDVPFDYRNGTVLRHATVVLLRNDNIY